MNQPTPEQAAAVVAFAKREGSKWKAKLHMSWMMASYPDDPKTWHLLQQLRNQLGPKWLERTTLKEIQQIAKNMPQSTEAAMRSLLQELRTARPLMLYGEGWIERIDQVLALPKTDPDEDEL